MSNLLNSVETYIHNVFVGIIKGISYSEAIIVKILTDILPVAEVVAGGISQPLLTDVEILGQILGTLEALGKNASATTQLAANIINPGVNVSVADAQALVTSSQSTEKAIAATITSISSLIKGKYVATTSTSSTATATATSSSEPITMSTN